MDTFTNWESELYHHGIKGQKWGYRRYQNEDGTLTAEGKARYKQDIKTSDFAMKNVIRQAYKLEKSASRNIVKSSKAEEKGNLKRAERQIQKAKKKIESASFRHAMVKTFSQMDDKDKRAIRIGVSIARVAQSYPFGGAIGGAVAGISGGSAMNKLVRETEKRTNRKVPAYKSPLVSW